MRAERLAKLLGAVLLAVVLGVLAGSGPTLSRVQGEAEASGFPTWLLVTSPEESLYQLRIGVDSVFYYAGEGMKVTYKVYKQEEGEQVLTPAYVYLLHFSTDGRAALILPNATIPLLANFDDAGEVTFRVPAQTPGTAFVQGIATEYPIVPPSLAGDPQQVMDGLLAKIGELRLTQFQWAATATSYRFTTGPIPFSKPTKYDIVVSVAEGTQSRISTEPFRRDARPLTTGVRIRVFDEQTGEEKISYPSAPAAIALEAGRYKLRVEHEEFLPAEDTITVGEREPRFYYVTLARRVCQVWFRVGKEDQGGFVYAQEVLSGDAAVFDACPFLLPEPHGKDVQMWLWDLGPYAYPPQIFGATACKVTAQYTLPDGFTGNARVPVTLTVNFNTKKRCKDLGAEVPKPEQGEWAYSCTQTREILIRPFQVIPPIQLPCTNPFGPVTLKVPPEGAFFSEGAASVEYLLQCPIPSPAQSPKSLRLQFEYLFKSLPEQSWFQADWFSGVAAVEVEVRLAGDSQTRVIGTNYLCTLNNFDRRCQAPMILPQEGVRQTEEVELLELELTQYLGWLIGSGRYNMIEISIRPLLLVLRNRDPSYRPGKAVEVQYTGQLVIQY